ncbi:helix-turn-helix domain-containing protein [Pacificimonas sp. WHA3]|uniref:Helix-turn-helix domain-containing protein n=1 Tax=Pacificimonas pallii TaxID=2827236 RepID=A0ABS6SF88_9SPHN|nr:helix-turn-helix domain-containing protein [Pacificimonas pallii]MBV7256601.1 helix-turn-helix domain-containing protein [Pacificimonas pallii]
MPAQTIIMSASPAPVTAAPHAATGETLFWEGDAAERLYRIESGIVRGVRYTEEGERNIVGFYFAGDMIGVPVAGAYRFTAEAVTDVTYTAVLLDRLADDVRSGGAARLFETVQTELGADELHSQLLCRHGALQRMCAFISGLYRRLGGATIEAIAQVDMADYLALTPETVCRSLKKMRDSGVIAMPRHNRIDVVDPGALAAMSFQ